jgi:hypothetical protein
MKYKPSAKAVLEYYLAEVNEALGQLSERDSKAVLDFVHRLVKESSRRAPSKA